MSYETKTIITGALFKDLIASTLNPPSGISLEAARNPAPQAPTSIRVSDAQPVKNAPQDNTQNQIDKKSSDPTIGSVRHGLDNVPRVGITQLSLRF